MLEYMAPRLLFTFLKKSIHKYTFVRTSINNWKKKANKASETPFKKKGRRNLLIDNLLIKVKDVILISAAGAMIYRRLVIAIGKGVVKAKNQTM